ncbi:extracellular solute-binding protein [Paucibacter sp. APW11]|uniref:Extracellular solute-binding protein n=1 Tax=Roseateles aquae TaxID=3077235 RepID=A0ABU3PIC8_9BURK|nr:extracellular solute-binding protein [Paucibacter sp. APW11]MDT9002310.1 extracellular solute-binding protein [Paucibacter sp. APW11]
MKLPALPSLLAAAWLLAAGVAAAQPRELERAARAEGQVNSAGMPDRWANWGETWADLKRLYGLQHQDENMNSGDEIAAMEQPGRRPGIDIGDVGFEFGALARSRGVTRAHKPANWAQIPDWAKDPDGHWALAYTGTIAFMVNTRRVASVPRSWKAVFDGDYKLLIGAVGPTAQANAGVLAAAIALGGAETRLQPALEKFAQLARQGRLLTDNPGAAQIEKLDADVFVMWDFIALDKRARMRRPEDYEILIPSDGSVTSGYTPIINKHAAHPNAAQLAREYIFSDAGQINLARGHARPIRIEHLNLPESVRGQLLDSAQYQSARVVYPAIWAWEVKKLPALWQREVLGAAR